MTDAHSAIAHRGRDKTEHYVRERYSGINQEVTELFVSLCILHQSQRSVTSYMKKPVVKPIAADGFLMHVEIDLTDFRNLPCSCSPSHNWVLHINDHYSKYSWLIPLMSKTCEQNAGKECENSVSQIPYYKSMVPLGLPQRRAW